MVELSDMESRESWFGAIVRSAHVVIAAMTARLSAFANGTVAAEYRISSCAKLAKRPVGSGRRARSAHEALLKVSVA